MTFRIIERCRGCHAPGTALREVFRMDEMPLAGEFSPTEAAARSAARYPLSWVECETCELVQVREDIADDLLFRNYNYASSTVPGLVRHFDALAGWMAARYGAERRRVLELGCNDGVLLRRLPAAWESVGVDPSDVAQKSAPGGQYELINEPFTESMGRTPDLAGAFDIVTGSNCLGHISDLLDVFRGAHAALRDGGELIVEVHDLDVTLATAQWDTVYHEHKAEWSERSLARCLGPIGFKLAHQERLPLHGGLLRAVFRKGPSPAMQGMGASANRFEALRNAYSERRRTAVYERLASAIASGRSIAAYGAAGRANVWLNQLPELPFSYIVDESPLRAGKWIPVVATPVVGRARLLEDPSDICAITAWNYAADIREKNAGYRGEWVQTFTDG